MSENNQWGELMEDFYDEQEDDLVLFFNESSLIYDTDDFDEDGFNDSISLALEIESLSDGVYGNLTLDVFNNRGYWIDGIEYDFEMNSDEIVYLDLWDVYYVHMLEDENPIYFVLKLFHLSKYRRYSNFTRLGRNSLRIFDCV